VKSPLKLLEVVTDKHLLTNTN